MIKDRDLLVERMADNLPILRKKLKLSQEEFAKIVGSSRYTVMLYETKKKDAVEYIPHACSVF